MKILYISYVKHGAGDWVHTDQFFSALKSIKSDVDPFLPLIEVDGTEGKLVKNKTYSNFGLFYKLWNLVGSFTRKLASFTKKLEKEIRRLMLINPDVVVLRAGRHLTCLPLCRLFNIPLLLEINGPFQENRFFDNNTSLHEGPLLERLLEKIILGLPSHIMVVSEPLRQYYIGQGISSEKITTIPNGVDIRKFHPKIDGKVLRRKIGLAGNIVVGFSGSFSKWHGLDFLLEATTEFLKSFKNNGEDIKLLLIGSSNGNFTMPILPAFTLRTGRVGYQEMPAYLSAIDIIVAPYPRIDPFYFSPLKIFEAMAMGKPVLASAQGQICELITDGVNGLLYTPGNRAEFLEKLCLLITNKALRQNLGKNARQTIENGFTWKDNASRVLKICDHIAKKV